MAAAGDQPDTLLMILLRAFGVIHT